MSRLPKRRPRKPLPTTGTDVTTTGAAGGIRNHAVSAASTTIALFAVPIAIGCSPLSTFCVFVISFAISSHTSSSSGSGGGPSNIRMARARAEIAEWDSRSAVAACGAPAAVLPLEHLWLAVPKSKVSASKKRIRNANRTPKLLKNWQMCKVCNKPKLMHRMCDEMRCFENEERRARGGAAAARAPDAHAVEREAD